MTSKTFSTGTPFCPSPDIDGLSFWSLSGFDDTPLSPPSTLGGLPFCPQPDLPLWPSPNNFHTHLSPTLSATSIKYEGYLGRDLVPPTLDTQTLPQGLDENQEFTFNLGEGNVQLGMSLSEGERIRKLEEEIKEVQILKTTMFNKLEVRAREWAELDKLKQRFEGMFAGFENKLGNIEAKMEEERENSKVSERIEVKPRERDKSKASGRIEKKPKEKPKKTQKGRVRELLYVDLRQ
jgi:hypothetical protein